MRHFHTILALLFFALLAGCNSSKNAPVEEKGSVAATKAFVKHFGEAPVVDKGKCYAFVIYFPSAKEPGKVIPFPFFSFDEASLKKVALGKLVGGIGELKGLNGDVAHLLPAGTRLLDVRQAGGIVTADFSKEMSAAKLDPAAERALANSIALTLMQFDGVTGVAIQVEGVPAPLDKLARSADPAAVVRLSTPRLLSVTAMKEKGEEGVEEVDVFFDRPVEIKELVISGADGKPFEGDTYQSVFDMAGVLKPKDAKQFKQGMPVRVRWSVTDKLGRSGSGESEMLLEVREH